MKTCAHCSLRYPNHETHCLVDGEELVVRPDPRLGTTIAGRYVIEEVVGEGGMATVYRAKVKLVDRFVAVKVMNPYLATDPIVRERFRREARSAQKLAHPNIIEIYDQGDTEDGTSYLVMELLHGESLASVVSRGALAIDRAIAAMIQIARGLARAHDLEVIHRDIKPENIFLCQRDDGTELVKLLDFGIAKSRHDSRLTDQGELFGTPQYMAPERISGAEVGGSSDLYALGVVFYEMLTGDLPFTAPDIATFFVKHMNEPPPSARKRNPKIPQALDDLVLRMLAKKPEERPVDAHRIHQDLLDVMASREMQAPPELESLRQAETMPPVTVAAGADPWSRRVYVLEQMLARAFGARQRAPGELTKLLDDLSGLVGQVEIRRSGAVEAQQALERIDIRGREKRAQLGFAVDQLGVDASKAKEDLRAARDTLKRATEETTAARDRYLGAQREVMAWEGRAGHAEPWPELAQAYRQLADAVDEWNALRQEELRAERACATAERVESDLDFQIRELRTALSKHERELDAARAACEAKIVEQETAADGLEVELLEVTSRFCQPLRTRPELQPLFKELETEAAA